MTMTPVSDPIPIGNQEDKENIEDAENTMNISPACDRILVDHQYTRDVVITAFDGQFEDLDYNPSSVVIDELLKEEIENVRFTVHKFPVSYETVAEKVPELREKYPDEVLHLAAHSVKNRVLFEEKAFSDGYVKKDVNGFVPEGNTISSENYEDADDRKSLKPFIDFDFLIEDVTEKCGLDGEKFGGLTVGKSQEPGRSVGGYLYYLSLRERPINTLLIHIPPFEGECTKEAVTNVIREAIKFITINDF
ncbi:Aspartoacylase [Caenorhabditis elegans]|uniref:Aspartoacylase n=1 Tax=Caenorhabditis elegans TaxID=6239 RepID=P90931_CAEEL|nr:Aspartoacylase [Caenorhabditis elegans]CAB06020.2 Aspartoacylase [Caenorhabditis elegans]|eukprot:NP_492489.2 Uncharacterized protein CELE_M04C9.2 [Caenorhabditis elegans]